MPLGTLDRTPPPFFRQGYSALTKLLFFAALAVFLMVADTRFELVRHARAAIATALLPVQTALRVPVDLWHRGADVAQGLQQALAAERRAQEQLAAQAERLARAAQLDAENEHLRALLGLQPALAARSTGAQVLYEAPDPFTRKLVIDRGTTHGVVDGSPVIDHRGVLGQVTRAYPLASEVTLLVDRDAAIPVLNQRTQLRGVAFGGTERSTAMELRFLAASADVQAGDELVTSGVDGVYPPGLPVARVARVDRQADGGFAYVLLQPVARPDGVRHVLVLEPIGLQLPPRPPLESRDAAAPARER
ncbi:MAG: rod shape-determining protein MreC [Burkholderiaceae bacterium]|jgi:rod shape-determining protein MreC|nr:rod shape-determining protein MreC [Burkholderiaceae bacterium]